MHYKNILLSVSAVLIFQTFAHAEKQIDLPVTPVTANPLGVSSDEFVIPFSVLNGRELDVQRGNNLAETLENTPGVSFSNWGPLVGRPVIRGMDGDRIRIMRNGINSIDVSSFSTDHAVPMTLL